MTLDQISVFVENSPGKLADVFELLAGESIDLRAMSIADTSSFGILRLIVDKPVRAQKVLADAEYLVQMTKVIPVAVSDTPGGLAKAIRVLSDADISVEYTYAFVGHKSGSAYVVFRVEDNEKAMEVLAQNGINVISAEELYEMN